ncbi:MAG: hypothetical protein KTR31_16000 [Myxococcales bacterium]|nr:hypothetical protein [Myxococcales bacterium]
MPFAAAGPLVRRLFVALLLLGFGLACSGGSLFGDDVAVIAEGRGMLEAGDLPAAQAEFAQVYAENPTSVSAATAFAYSQVLAGDLKGADRTLASIEPSASDRLGEVRLRRALVALRARDLDAVRKHGSSSELPEGMLLAAEVHLIDLESEAAAEMLRRVQASGGPAGATAQQYLNMINSGDPNLASLADTTALWALGERRAACEAAEELVRELSVDAGRDEQLLLWAGRAATSGLPTVARSLLDAISFPPEGQSWRVKATYAMVDLLDGRTDRAMSTFEALQKGAEAGDVPREGLSDALATACGLIKDPELASRLVQRVESAAAARCLMLAGDVETARAHAPSGPLSNFLEFQ